MQTQNNQMNRQFCPLIDEIILNNPTDSKLKLKKTLSLESKCNELIKEIIKDCEYNKEHSIKRDNALFSTTYLDRATICHSLNKLSSHIKTLKLSSRVKVFLPTSTLIHLLEKFERLEVAIKSCESIKVKHINERSSFNSLPTDIQIKIITSIPPTKWPNLYFFLESLKKLYTLDESLFYRNILPLLIDLGFINCRMDSYSQEFREIAPYLKSIDESAALLNSLKINAKHLTSVQSLKINYQDFISFREKETYLGEFAEEIDEEIFYYLGNLSQLEKIELTGTAVYFEESILNLKKLTNLQTLSLNVLDNSNFTIFSQLTNLRTLKLGFSGENHELKHLGYGISQMTYLKNLYLDLRTEKFLTMNDLRLFVMPHFENLNICYGSYKHYSKPHDSDPADLTVFFKKEYPNTNIFLKKINYNSSSNLLSIAGFEEFKEISKMKLYS